MDKRIDQQHGEEFIELYGVNTHNLKDLTVRFPLSSYSVVTGVSGSGKSSLVFDTLYSESYRRYVESLSSFARQYLKKLPRPAIEQAKNLPPAVAVQQQRGGVNSRSTVGTLTELTDILRVLYVHASQLYCPGCRKPVRKESGESIAQKMLEQQGSQRLLVLAPIKHLAKMKAAALKGQLESSGFIRAFLDGAICRISALTGTQLHKSDIVIDRIDNREENIVRLVESIELAFKAGNGEVGIINEEGNRYNYSCALRCVDCELSFSESTVSIFNFNHPSGACSECQGYGRVSILDTKKILPDLTKSLSTEGVSPWNFGRHVAYYSRALESAQLEGIDIDKPFQEYSDDELRWLFEGDDRGIFAGVDGYFRWLDRKKYKPHYRIHAARFYKYVTCPECKGERLNALARSYEIDGRNIAEVSRMPITSLNSWLGDLKLAAGSQGLLEEVGETLASDMGLLEAIEEAKARVTYLLKVGLGYLSVDRRAKTLSGGELQRINMARNLGSALTGTLFCLDEPSSGLHVRDSQNLLDVIYELKERGNSIVVVEHEQNLIKGADHLIEVGPCAGKEGGYLVYDGPPGALQRSRVEADIVMPAMKNDHTFLELKCVRTNNLKGIDVKIPLCSFTVVCGVSGSGKTSLVRQTLYPLLADLFGQKVEQGEVEPKADGITPLQESLGITKVIFISQDPIHRSVRSNIATYLGIFDDIRKSLAQTPLAKAKQLGAGAFSFNTPGGRCETCKGLGTVIEDLSFLGEMSIQCPTCEGARFDDEVLGVNYRGYNLLDILNLTITEARELFFDKLSIVKILDAIIEIGLGYVTLGQHTSSFSGGEAQRLKLLSLLKEVKNTPSHILIFDEPTTGLSDRDVRVMLQQFRRLVEKGNTIIVVEHHLDVMRAADWLIEIGPEAAAHGGELVFQGVPAEIKKVSRSVTARFI